MVPILGQKYRAERERQGISPEELAVLLRGSTSQIAHLELGYHQPSLGKAARFSAALGCRVDDFIVDISK